MTSRKPLCPRCADTAGWIEDNVTGQVIRRCPCRTAEPSPTAAKADALAAVEGGNPNALNAAIRIITDAAHAMPTFSANDIRQELDFAQVSGPVVGAAFGRAVRDGLIRRDGYLPSTKGNTHGHPVSIWRSMIYRGRVSA